VSILIPRNTTIPTSAREMFTTSVDGQTVVDMHVVQGGRELAKDCRSLARFELRGIDPMAAGMPKIEVTFLIDANGILQVAAREQRTGKATSIEVKRPTGLAEADVERMVEESFQYAEADVSARLLIEARNEADTVLTTCAARSARAVISSARTSVAASRPRSKRWSGRARARPRSHPGRDDGPQHATEHLAELLMDARSRARSHPSGPPRSWSRRDGCAPRDVPSPEQDRRGRRHQVPLADHASRARSSTSRTTDGHPRTRTLRQLVSSLECRRARCRGASPALP